MRMKLLDQEQTQASTRTSNDTLKTLLWLLILFIPPVLIFVIIVYGSTFVSAREELVNELIIEQGYESRERHYEKIHFAEKDGTEYILIVNEVEVDGEMKVEVTPFEKGANEDLN